VIRGKDEARGSLFSYVDLEQRIRPDHPLRMFRALVNTALADMSAELDALYPPMGRDSIPPERLLRALLLQAFFSIRSERQLVERIDVDLLFRWFVGLGVDDPVWDATTFTRNRDRLLAGEVASRFLATVLAQPKVRALLSTEHFSVDGTLLEAWASSKSFRRKDGSGPPPDAGRNGEQDFRCQKRSNDTHDRQGISAAWQVADHQHRALGRRVHRPPWARLHPVRRGRRRRIGVRCRSGRHRRSPRH
jgi:transposase